MQPASQPQADPAGAEAFLTDLAHALHRHGMPAYRIEDALTRVGSALGVQLQAFTTPTGLQLAFGPLESQRLRLLRVEPGFVNLARVAALSELIEDIVEEKLDATAASARLMIQEREALTHGRGSTLTAWAVASGTSAVFFGGGAQDAIAASCIGLLVGWIAVLARKHDRIARVFDVLASSLAASLAGLLHLLPWSISRDAVTLSAIVVLLPGYSFTVALNELAAKHLSSGTARLGGVFTTLLMLVFGTAVGYTAIDIAERGVGPWFAHPAVPEWSSHALPLWMAWVALVLAPLSYKVLFQARHRDTAIIVVAAVLAFLAARLGARQFEALDPERAKLAAPFGAGLGAFVLGVFSNLLARWRRLPAALSTVPGLLILVPGSTGFRSLSSFLGLRASDGTDPTDLLVGMVAIGVALVCGLLVANVMLPSRRSL